MILLLALLIGIVAGLRTMTAPAAVAWAAYLNWFNLGDGWLSFMGHWITPWVFTVLALAEFAADQLPSTPSRTVPMQFGARPVGSADGRDARRIRRDARRRLACRHCRRRHRYVGWPRHPRQAHRFLWPRSSGGLPGGCDCHHRRRPDRGGRMSGFESPRCCGNELGFGQPMGCLDEGRRQAGVEPAEDFARPPNMS